VVIEKSGTPASPIRFVAASGEHVVMTGADHIAKWEQAGSKSRIYKTPWPHRFITWNESNTHPSDDLHRMIGRAEQVFVNGYPLLQVLSREQMSRGTFYVDLDEKELYVWGRGDEELDESRRVEASARERIWESKGDYIQVRGIRFRYAANEAQHGAAESTGNHGVVEDCVFEKTNGAGADFRGRDTTVRRCTFQDNGQLGFGASGAHHLHMTGCTIRDNNTKDFNRGWEAGGNKLCMSRGVVIESSSFIENRGNGIRFDIGDEDCTVRNCLIADNEDAGIFYEISYGLHAHDNAITGNGFDSISDAWGAFRCRVLHCVIERNLLVGNKEGFQFREQERTTPKIGQRRVEHPIWNHDEVIRSNVIALNRDAQVWGWFDVRDERHWPAAMQTGEQKAPAKEQPKDLSLEKLKLQFRDNVYCAAQGQGLFNWGVAWRRNKRYTGLGEVRQELNLEEGGVIAEPRFADPTARDFRIPADSEILAMGCYPRGEVPGVTLGITPR
jgi:hypothetical protein